jgi:hypothetical protein
MKELEFLEDHPLLSNKLTIEIKPTLEIQRWNSHINFEVTLKVDNNIISRKLESFNRSTQDIKIDRIFVQDGKELLKETYESEIRIAWENIVRKIGKVLEENGMLMSYRDFVQFAAEQYGPIED